MCSLLMSLWPALPSHAQSISMKSFGIWGPTNFAEGDFRGTGTLAAGESNTAMLGDLFSVDSGGNVDCTFDDIELFVDVGTADFSPTDSSATLNIGGVQCFPSPPGAGCWGLGSVNSATQVTVVSGDASPFLADIFPKFSNPGCGFTDLHGVGTELNFDSLPAMDLVAAILPNSRSVQVGFPATAFATIINTDDQTATNCGIAPITSVPADFLFQTTDPLTNVLTGTTNTPVDIAGGNGIQTYVFAFTPTAPIAPTEVQLSFACDDSAADVVVGLNTLLLSASDFPVPDIVALGATIDNDGIVKLSSTGVKANT